MTRLMESKVVTINISLWLRSVLCAVLFLICHFQSASGASSNYSPYQYDQTTPLFTPDGRLLQVEYASKAVDDYSNPLIILALNETVSAIVACTPRQSLLSRLVVLPATDVSPSNVVVALSGVLPDGMALLQQVQDYARQQQQRTGGLHPSARSLALYAASVCHRRAMGGGIRPFGARLTILETQQQQELRTAWITDPSGTVRAVEWDVGNTGPVVVFGDREQRLSRTFAKVTHKNLRGVALLRKTVKECFNVLQKVDDKTDYQMQVIIWSSRTGEVYELSKEQTKHLLQFV